MVHDSSIGLNNYGHAIVGDVDSDGIVHGILLTNNVEVVVGAIHAHVLN